MCLQLLNFLTCLAWDKHFKVSRLPLVQGEASMWRMGQCWVAHWRPKCRFQQCRQEEKPMWITGLSFHTKFMLLKWVRYRQVYSYFFETFYWQMRLITSEFQKIPFHMSYLVTGHRMLHTMPEIFQKNPKGPKWTQCRCSLKSLKSPRCCWRDLEGYWMNLPKEAHYQDSIIRTFPNIPKNIKKILS